MIANPLEREIEQTWLALCELRFKETRTISVLPGSRLSLVSGTPPGSTLVGNYTNRIALAEFRADIEFVLWQGK